MLFVQYSENKRQLMRILPVYIISEIHLVGERTYKNVCFLRQKYLKQGRGHSLLGRKNIIRYGILDIDSR